GIPPVLHHGLRAGGRRLGSGQGDRARRRRRARRGRRRHRHRHHLRQGHRVRHAPARDARRDHVDPVAGLRAHRGVLLLRAGRGPHRVLPL
ncbi:MAG: hypothetical protein AVDCRST_MAG30-2546, partial [uncultured Solirubrobacteraceae bacterium]